MAIITLTTFLWMDQVDSGETYELDGALDGLVDLPFPDRCFTGVYGQSAAVLAAELYQKAVKEGKTLLICEVEADGGPNMHARTNLNVTEEERSKSSMVADLSEMKTLEVKHGKKRLWDDIEQRWYKFLKEEGNVDLPGEEFPRKYTGRPDMIKRLRRSMPYKHLDIIIYPVRTPGGKSLTLATVFNPKCIKSMVIFNDHSLKAVLPKDFRR